MTSTSSTNNILLSVMLAVVGSDSDRAVDNDRGTSSQLNISHLVFDI